MLLDSVEDVHAVLAVHHVHSQAPLAEAASAPNSVQVGLVVRVPVLVHWKVKVDDHRHLLNVDACTKERWEKVRAGEKKSLLLAQSGHMHQRWVEGVWVGRLWIQGQGHAAEPEVNPRALAGANKITQSVGGLCSPRAHTLVVTSTFSLPSRKRSITAALCSTIISPLSRATWWPSLESSAASQLAVLRVWSKKNGFK